MEHIRFAETENLQTISQNFTLQIFLYPKDQDSSINSYYMNERAQIPIGRGMRTAKGNCLAACTPYFLLLNGNGLFNSFAFSYMLTSPIFF